MTLKSRFTGGRFCEFGLLLLAITTASVCHGQGEIVTFSGHPSLPPTWKVLIREYTERGLWFTSMEKGGGFGLSGGAEENPAFPRNGGPHIEAAYLESLSFSSVFGGGFDLYSVDLSEFSTLYDVPLTVQFVGYRTDGTVINAEFITDGIIDGAGPLADFQTFHFDERFRNLSRVEVPSYGWSMDNIVFSYSVPEPTPRSLCLLSAVVMIVMRKTKLATGRHPKHSCPFSMCNAPRVNRNDLQDGGGGGS